MFYVAVRYYSRCYVTSFYVDAASADAHASEKSKRRLRDVDVYAMMMRDAVTQALCAMRVCRRRHCC